MTMQTDTVAVEQCDMDLAADALDAMGWDWGASGDVRHGRVKHPLVELFARRRLAALQHPGEISPEAFERAPKHHYWGAGESDCPKDIKAGNGELYKLRCKVCGLDNPRNPICNANKLFEDADAAIGAKNAQNGGVDGARVEARERFLDLIADASDFDERLDEPGVFHYALRFTHCGLLPLLSELGIERRAGTIEIDGQIFPTLESPAEAITRHIEDRAPLFAVEERCQAPGCYNPTTAGICEDCNCWVDKQVEKIDVIAAIVRDVAELPDRTSPEDWPEAMLVTADELTDIIDRHAAEFPLRALPIAALASSPPADLAEYREVPAKLLAFVLACSAENPAHIGSYRNKAVDLLESIGIEPRETGLFYHDRDAELADVAALLSKLGAK